MNRTMARTAGRCAVSLLAGFVGLASCSSDDEPVYTDLRIYESPYDEVDWQIDLRLKAQHHDHIGNSGARVLAYDRAGYDVLSVMDYSGKPTAEFSWRERIWPPEAYFPSAVLSQLTHIKILVPSAEEAGLGEHATSPFLSDYIEVSEGGGPLATWQYRDYAGLLSAIRSNGGSPCIAHPWYEDLTRHANSATCVEVYSAYAEAMRHAGRPEYAGTNRNEQILKVWDRMLDLNERIVGIAVNDHTGPYLADGSMPDQIRDSGKILVMAREATLEAYQEAFERGAVIAVRDNGEIKDQYPVIRGVSINEDGASIDVDGDVTWTSRGAVIGRGNYLDRSELPANTRWVRAEVRDAGETVQFLQAFVVRPVGDVDGDYDIDENDSRICDDPMLGARPPRERRACAALSP